MSFGILPGTDDLSVASTTHTVTGTLDAAPNIDGGVAIDNGNLGVVTVDTATTTHALTGSVDSTASTLPDVSSLTGTVTGASPVGLSLPNLDGVTGALPVDVSSLTGTVTGALPDTGLGL